MKLLQRRHIGYLNYAIFFLPIFISGILIFYYFPEQVVLASKFILPLFLLFLLVLAVTPAGNYIINQKKSANYSFVRWLGFWLMLQLGLSIIYLAVRQSVMGSLPIIPVAAQTNYSLLLHGGLYPWTLYTLLGLTFAYFPAVQNQSPLRTVLQPIFQKSLESHFGIGIDLFIKKCIIFLCSITIGILITEFSDLLSFFLNLPTPTGLKLPIILLSSITFFIIASRYWRRTTRYLGDKHFSLGTILAFIAFIIISISLLLNIIVKIISPYFWELLELPLRQGWSAGHPWPIVWFIFSLIWWTAWAPVVGHFIARLAQNHTIRATILVSLLFPACFTGLSWLIEHHSTLAHLASSTPLLLENEWVELALTLVAILATLLFFKSTSGLGLEHPSRLIEQPVSISLIRAIASLIVTSMVVYLMTGIPFITLLVSGAVIPVFLILFIACLGLIIFAPYRHFVEK